MNYRGCEICFTINAKKNITEQCKFFFDTSFSLRAKNLNVQSTVLINIYICTTECIKYILQLMQKYTKAL